MSPALSPRQLLSQLKQGHQSYRDLFRAGETTAFCFYKHFSGERRVSEFFRPSVGFVVLSEDRTLSPSLLFNQREEEIFVDYVAPEEAASPATVAEIEQAYQVNRLRLIVLLAVIAPPPGLDPDPLRRVVHWIRSSDRFYLWSLRRALLTVAKTSEAIQKESDSIRRALEEESLAVVEALYDPISHEIHLDVGHLGHE